jgi:hypothetical protein
MRVVTTALLLAALASCTDEPTVSESVQGVSSTNKIGINKIAINKIAINKIAINKIAINKIAINKIAINSLAVHDLLNSPDCQPGDPPDAECGGRDVLDYLIGCAFPSGVTLSGTSDAGVTYEFQGSIGLAERWEYRRLTFKEQRWMSACMLARVSNVGQPLLISLRGPHDALVVTTEEANDFVLEEGAYYGDIFSEQQRFYACRGEDNYNGNMGAMGVLRACATPVGDTGLTMCGMTYAGDCGAFNDERACDVQTGDYYERCHTYPSKNGKWHDEGIENRFEEAVTVYASTSPIHP